MAVLVWLDGSMARWLKSPVLWLTGDAVRRECPSGAVHHGIVCNIECKAQKMCHVAVRQPPVAVVQGEGISDKLVNGKMVMHKKIRMSRLFSVFGAWTGWTWTGSFFN